MEALTPGGDVKQAIDGSWLALYGRWTLAETASVLFSLSGLGGWHVKRLPAGADQKVLAMPRMTRLAQFWVPRQS